MTAMKKRLERTREYFAARPRLRRIAFVALILAMTAIQWLQLDLSCGTRVATVLRRSPVFIPVNMALLFLVDLVFLLFTRRWSAAYLAANVLTLIWSVADHYAWMFSGEPITVTTLFSAGTAMDVLAGYRLPFDLPVAAAIAAFLAGTAMAIALRALESGPIPWKRMALAPIALAVMLTGAYGLAGLLERTDTDVLWSSQVYLTAQGYPVYFLRQGLLTVHQVQTPAGYDDEAMARTAEALDGTGTPGTGETPDIFFILNETFYDLDLYTDTQADAPYLEAYHAADNAIRGYAAIPGVGGGTNRAEFELLTSNSMFLVSAQAPFITMDMTRANSLVSYLKTLGYTACAMHQASPTNYNRGRTYPALGFDETIFRDRFTADAYGDRNNTDRANYRDMLSWYPEEGEGPRFTYLLTYQNHGGYEQNDPSLDTVHARRDFGDLTDDVSEYLTSIRLSDQALGELFAALDESDRPAIVCMVGDHGPNFLTQLPARAGLSDQERETVSRQTPYIIWANKAFGPLPAEMDGMDLSCVDLAPTVLQLAGLPLSPFYRTILGLRDAVPCRLSTGLYRTAEGEYGSFAPDDPLFGTLAPYYYMEYNNIRAGADRVQTLFDPPGT